MSPRTPAPAPDCETCAGVGHVEVIVGERQGLNAPEPIYDERECEECAGEGHVLVD